MLDAAVDEATIDVPDALVDARAHELWDQMLHSLSHQGIPRRPTCRSPARTEEELVDEAKPDAERALRREAVLAAVVEAEGIEAADERAARGARRPAAERESTTPGEAARAPAPGRARWTRCSDDVAARSALDLMAEAAKPISVEQAKARDKLWTPEREPESGSGQLWTPGS